MIIVQEIVTEWSKTSRGGKEASRRNATPSTLKLPSIPAGVDVAVHSVRITEWGKFKPRSTVSVDNKMPLRLGCVEIKSVGEAVIARFQYTTDCGGAPERGWMRKEVRIAPGQSAQIQYNGRFSWESAWMYRHTVINIAVVDEPTPKLFTHNRPTIKFAAMALLR